MKKALLKKRASFLAIIFLLISQFTFSQAPPSNINGEELKTWLRTNTYDGKHQTLGYSNARKYLYNYIDNESGVITCVYSGFTVNSAYGGTTTYPAPINCEHTIPQSFFGEADPMVSDIHHLYPTYENWNSTRSNYPLTDIDDNITVKWMYLNQSLMQKRMAILISNNSYNVCRIEKICQIMLIPQFENNNANMNN